MHPSPLIREVSSCSLWWLTQRLTTGQCTEREFGTFSPKWGVLIKPLPSRPRELFKRTGINIIRARIIR